MNSSIYIKIPDPGTYLAESWFFKVLKRLIPPANPDFEDLYSRVEFWVLKIRLEDGRPLREVGFDSKGSPIVAGPIGKNRGMWVDSQSNVSWRDAEKVNQEFFSSAWGKVQSSLYYKYRPATYRTMEKWIRECRHLCSLTKRICAGEGDFIDNVHRMAAYGYNMREQKNEAFQFFFHLCSETSHLPAGKARQHWDKDALLLKDEEIRDIEAYYHGETIKYSMQIHGKYSKILHENSLHVDI